VLLLELGPLEPEVDGLAEPPDEDEVDEDEDGLEGEELLLLLLPPKVDPDVLEPLLPELPVLEP